MKSLQEQYNLITEGKGHKDVFLKDAKSRYPDMLTNSSTFENTTKILVNRGVIKENLGGVVTLKPITKIESLSKKESWEDKFVNFLNEAGTKELNALVNDDIDPKNSKKEEEKIKAEEKKVSKEVENSLNSNYDYSPKVDNINNVNGQEMLNGVYYESKQNPELSLEELQAKVIKNLSEDELYYVKEGQFGVEGVGYVEQKVSENDGESYGGSGYSEKLKEGSDDMVPVKEGKERCTDCEENSEGIELISESIGGVVTTGNPNSLAAMSGQIIKQMMSEAGEFKADDAGSQYHSSLYAENEVQEDEGESISYKDTDVALEEKKKDHDGDGDIDSDDYLAARDKAIKAAKAKKPKKESIDSKLAEIGKAGDVTKLEAQLEFLSNHIDEKIQRVSSINEDDNLKELIDKSKMKAMQKEIKLLEKRKGKMEKMYEKMCGKKFQQTEIVDEAE